MLNEFLLYLAVLRDEVEIVKLLLIDPGININRHHAYGDTPLTLAACRGRTGIVELLLADPRIDPNIKAADGKTALNKAISQGKMGAIDLFLEHGAYTEADLDVIKEKFPELWERHQARFRETFEALDQGPLAGQASIISSLVAEVLYPFVPFFDL